MEKVYLLLLVLLSTSAFADAATDPTINAVLNSLVNGRSGTFSDSGQPCNVYGVQATPQYMELMYNYYVEPGTTLGTAVDYPEPYASWTVDPTDQSITVDNGSDSLELKYDPQTSTLLSIRLMSDNGWCVLN